MSEAQMSEQKKEAQRISEVIKRLEAIKEKLGDLEVFINYDEEWQWFNNKEFVLKHDENGTNVIVIE
jgi:predicted CopG family antitoxin